MSSLHFHPLVPHCRRHFQGDKIVPYWVDCRYENFKGNSRNHTKIKMLWYLRKQISTDQESLGLSEIPKLNRQ